MAIALRLDHENSQGKVMIPTRRWEWDAIRDGDFREGKVAIVMVAHHPAGGTKYDHKDTPVVIDVSDGWDWRLLSAAEQLVREVMGVTPDASYSCFTPEQYQGYRAWQTRDITTGVQRDLQLPSDSDEED